MLLVVLLLVFSFLLSTSRDRFADVLPPVVLTDVDPEKDEGDREDGEDEELDGGEADGEVDEEVATRGGATERLNSR